MQMLLSLGFVSLLVFANVLRKKKALGESCGLTPKGCPGSPVPWSEHASCSESIRFEASCADVQEEIEARIKQNADRKELPGNYSLIFEVADTCIKGSRATNPAADPGPFTDLFGFVFSGSGQTCTVNSCSESQVPSHCDLSTNFCNMYNLYCNSAAGCEPILHDISYGFVTFGQNCNHGAACGGLETKISECV
eukprot:TRINITY_DN13632_c0_g2_i1.p1 TRINITY_DN13632_c0_g2~~TRINITY_DN13632_c0_g2_i1.p1  ORF type:complete len:194 (+),score=23.62 TRINITY_DN13632_c0_g2_i1:74-655(+)